MKIGSFGLAESGSISVGIVGKMPYVVVKADDAEARVLTQALNCKREKTIWA